MLYTYNCPQYTEIMETRVLRYFLESARQGSITKAAQLLNVTQPTMSRQLKDLEYELGETLFQRTNYAIKLTPAGELLYKRAEDIIGMIDKTKHDFESFNKNECEGDIAIGCAESKNVKYLAKCVQNVQRRHPKIRCNLYAGDTERVAERLDKGLFDFAAVVENVDLEKYNCLTVPAADTWGVLIQKKHPLAKKEAVTIKDLSGIPIICSRQSLRTDVPKLFGDGIKKLNVTVTTDLSFNGSVFVKEGTSCMLTFDGITDISAKSGLCFRPLRPKLTSAMYIIWRRFQTFTPAAELLLGEMKAAFK